MNKRHRQRAPGHALAAVCEKDFQRTVVALAKTLGWWVRHDRVAQQSEPGWPDLTLVRVGPDGVGRFILAELKREGRRLTPTQATVGDLLKACRSVEYYVWRPSDWDEIAERLR